MSSPRLHLGFTALLALFALAACGGEDTRTSGSGGGATGGGSGNGTGGGTGGADLTGSPYTPAKLPPLGDVLLTTDETVIPVNGILGTQGSDTDPRVVDIMNDMIGMGWGDTTVGAAETPIDWTLDGSAAPPTGPGRQLLTRFVHLADTQLADDESPARLALYDGPDITGAAFRAQEGYECRILNAAVRTVNALHDKAPIDFVMLGGDNVDNAQQNELDWFMATLDGAPKVECDSGVDDDPAAGADNDPKDPYFAEGLGMPWYWVTGNHDVLNQGNFPAPSKNEDAIGERALGGTRDWSKPGAPVTTDYVTADPRRTEMARQDLMALVNASGDGHGISADMVDGGKAYYSFDAPGGVRFVVVDTATETGGSSGIVRQGDVDAYLVPMLDAALADGKLVVVVSHHGWFTLGDGSDFGGTTQDDAISAIDFVDILGAYPNVIMHLAGHTHVHRVTLAVPTDGGHTYWHLETSALSDFPFQMRLLEIWDEDDGFLSIRGVPVDFSTSGDPVAAEGRMRATIDWVSSWGKDGSGDATQRAVTLWIAKP